MSDEDFKDLATAETDLDRDLFHSAEIERILKEELESPPIKERTLAEVEGEAKEFMDRAQKQKEQGLIDDDVFQKAQKAIEDGKKEDLIMSEAIICVGSDKT